VKGEMRAKALSVTVVLSLVVWSLAGCAARGPRRMDEYTPDGRRAMFSWSRVAELAPAAEIVVTRKGSRPVSRQFVSADQSRVVLLNLTDPALAASSPRILRDMASRSPEGFGVLQTTGTLAHGDVRIGRDGLFVANRKVADLNTSVETVARDDVSEIVGPVVARGSGLGAALGAFLGFCVGVVPGLAGGSAGAAWTAVIGSVSAGAFLGSYWSTHETQDFVYRAP